jgi:hypothetical protein
MNNYLANASRNYDSIFEDNSRASYAFLAEKYHILINILITLMIFFSLELESQLNLFVVL